MHMVTKKVEEEISRSLPEKFCILLDGWTHNSTHYVGVFASYSSTDANGYQTALLTFSPLLSELSLTALEHKNCWISLFQSMEKISRTLLLFVVIIVKPIKPSQACVKNP